MNGPGSAGAFLFGADGTSLLGPDAENKNKRRDSAGHSLILSPSPKGSAKPIPPSPQVNYPQEVASFSNFGYRITTESLQIHSN
jgi:hypothetical protein